MQNVLQRIVGFVRLIGSGIGWVVVGIVLAFAWGLGLVAGMFGLRREPSPVALLSIFAALLFGVLGLGIAFQRYGAEGTATAHSTPDRTAAVPERLLRPSANDATARDGQRSQGREASRQQARDLHENDHLRQTLELPQLADAANASAAQEKPQVADVRHECKEQGGFGPGRVVTLNARGGGEYGLVSFRNTLPLNTREVVFTFDDGPHPVRTPQILDILDRYCIKAVFFMIGDMAERSPELVREIKQRGHTIGGHTLSHPMHLGYISEPRAEAEIERGFAAVNAAAGEPVAPFFRFPGLGHSKRMLEYAARRNLAVWSVDVVSGDSEGASAGRMPALVMARLEKHGRGILLFHDIKKTTVDALPRIIEMLRSEGYHAAQVVPAAPYTPDPDVIARLDARKQQAAELRSRWRYR